MKKHGQYIVTANYYRAKQYFDADGNKQSQMPYVKKEVSSYYEYGLNDRITLGGQFSAAHVINRSPTLTVESLQIGDSEIFLRQRIWKAQYDVVSLQPYLSLISPNDISNNVTVGTESIGVGLKLQYGISFPAFGKYHYADLSAGYLHRNKRPADQWKFDATLGLRLDKKWELLPQLFITKSTRDIRNIPFTQTPADDYDATKMQLTLQYNYSPKTSVQLSAHRTIDGKNTGIGTGVMLGIVKNF